MRKLVMLLLLAVLALGILPGVNAAPVSELTALAQYFPDTTLGFIAIRSDDGLFTELDSLVAKMSAKLPEGMIPPGVSLAALLDLGAQQLTGQDFAGGIRSWLGDTIAVGAPSLEGLTGSSPQVVVAAEISNRAGAEAFVERLGALGGLARSTQPPDGYTMYESNVAGGGVVLIGDSVLFAALDETSIKQVLNVGSPLSNSARFQESLALLPADQYHVLAYIDVSQVIGMSILGMRDLVEAEVIGFTVLDGDTLALDIAVNMGDDSNLASVLGYSLPQLNPVDPAFAANIPGDASFVIHASDVKAIIDSYLNAFLSTSPDSVRQQFQDQHALVVEQIKAFSGLDLDADILDWMTGDFALWLRADMARIMDFVVENMNVAGGAGNTAAPDIEQFAFGFGLVIEATDVAKAQNLASVLGTLLTQYGTQIPNSSISSELIGGTEVTVLSFTDAPSGITFDVVMGANDRVFLLADRASATAILTGDGTLAQDATFAAAGNYILPDSTGVVYLDGNGVLVNPFMSIFTLALLGPTIGNVFDTIVDDLQGTATPEELARREEEQRRQNEQMRQIMTMIRSVTAMFESGSMSGATVDGDTVARIVLTLAD